MVKVLSSFVRGPLEPHVAGFAEALLARGYSRTSAAQHVCFVAHLDRAGATVRPATKRARARCGQIA